MRAFAVLFTVSTIAFGYGYWDVFEKGGRVMGLTPVSASLAGSTVPYGGSPMQIFTNPSGLSGSRDIAIAVTGWGTTWREEVNYERNCPNSFRTSKGGLSPAGSLALSVPLGNGFNVGAGFATVSQYGMRASAQEYQLDVQSLPALWKSYVADGSGNLNEALAAVAGKIGPVRVGLAAGSRFGSGETTLYCNYIDSSYDDTVYVYPWESSEFAVRAGASMDAGCSRLYATFVSGDDRYSSYSGIGVQSSFPFMNGGFIGTELGMLDGDELLINASASIPWAWDGARIFAGFSGYRPDNALKTGLGISFGAEYAFGSQKVNFAYQWAPRYRNGTGIDIEFITFVYDSGESFLLGYETTF